MNNQQMSYSENQIKIYTNKELEIYQEFILETLNKTYLELIELINIFSVNSKFYRLRELEYKRKLYDKKYQPFIKEAKRNLVNTRKRFKYNFEKVDYQKKRYLEK